MSDPITRLPLISFDSQGSEWGEGFPDLFDPALAKIKVPAGVGEDCYAVRIGNNQMPATMVEGTLAIFSIDDALEAKDSIYALAVRGEPPSILRVLVKEQGAEGGLPRSSRQVRKSFMTPTPLHIPGSRISPIPEFSHNMLFLKPLNDSDPVRVVPRAEILWMHPLLAIVEGGD